MLDNFFVDHQELKPLLEDLSDGNVERLYTVLADLPLAESILFGVDAGEAGVFGFAYIIPLLKEPIEELTLEEDVRLFDSPWRAFSTREKESAGKSLGAEKKEDSYLDDINTILGKLSIPVLSEDLSLISKLSVFSFIRGRSLILIDFKNIKNKQLTEEQINEIVAFALMNPETVEVVIYNSEPGSDALKPFRGLKNVDYSIKGDINQAYERYKNFKHILNISKQGVEPKKEANSAVQDRVQFFRYQPQEERPGLVALALRYPDLSPQELDRIGLTKTADGYITAVAEFFEAIALANQVSQVLRIAA
jgi:hypothetical protein